MNLSWRRLISSGRVFLLLPSVHNPAFFRRVAMLGRIREAKKEEKKVARHVEIECSLEGGGRG
jgi:hypothetical protein